MFENGVYFSREGYILGASYIVKGGIFWKVGVDSGSVAYILGGMCIFWECHLELWKRGVYSEKDG